MARTRDPRSSSSTESEPHERHILAQVNVPEKHRIYEENELSAAEALVGINASPTGSAPPSGSATSAYSTSQVQPVPIEKGYAPNRGSSSSSMSSKGKKKNRGRFSSVTVASRSEVDQVDGASHSAKGNADADGERGIFLQEGVIEYAQIQSEPQSDEQVQEQQTCNESEVTEQEPSPAGPHSKDKRKRKRGESVSVAAISRGQVDGIKGEGKSDEALEDLSGLPEHSRSEPPTPTPMRPSSPVPQTQEEVGPNPMSESAVNETNGTKSKPRNFDKVIFGRWQIKTWYYSPYPISVLEDDNASVSTGPTRHGGAPSASKKQFSKRGGVRARPRAQNTLEASSPDEQNILRVCDRCFKYMQEGSMVELHSRLCERMCPPGRKVYERGAHIIYEIDGAKDKLYCQNLSLFGKLFIDIKTLFYDCENFMFYVLTEGDGPQDHVIGFFSKEKVSFDDYNLACIITFPPYQRKRYGMLMIEFSYELSRRAGKLGTPERPLSELGLRTYLTYWTGALVQFFRRVLSVNPADFSTERPPVDDDLIRFIESRGSDGPRKRRKSIKINGDFGGRNSIWEGGLENEFNNKDAVAATSGANDALYKQMRWMRTSANPDGSATTHIFARCTLQDISNATGIRTEDVAFTLNECGLLRRIQALDSEEMEEVIVISREMIEHVAQEFKVKDKMCMEVQYCKF